MKEHVTNAPDVHEETGYKREKLFGQWYRTDIDEQGQQTSEYALLSPDGSFEFTFAILNNKGEVLEQTIELGDWGLVGDIHFTMTKSELVDGSLYGADLADENNYHAYQVLQLNSKIFEYRHIVTNEVFIMRRVIDTIAHC
jgi:hypothetical protein